jgi:hypothetical protein
MTVVTGMFRLVFIDRAIDRESGVGVLGQPRQGPLGCSVWIVPGAWSAAGCVTSCHAELSAM